MLTVLIDRVCLIPADGAVMDIHSLRIICMILSHLKVVHLYRLLCNVFHSCDTQISVAILEGNRSASIVNRSIRASLYFVRILLDLHLNVLRCDSIAVIVLTDSCLSTDAPEKSLKTESHTFIICLDSDRISLRRKGSSLVCISADESQLLLNTPA